MKKTILNLLLAIVAVAGFTACSSSDDYQRATVSGEQVFFPNTLPSTQNISFDKSSFTIAVGRQNTSGSLSVSITATGETEKFSIPSSVTFADGSNLTELTVGYDPDALEYGEFHSMTLAIADESLQTPYGAASYTFSVGIPEPFVSLGKGKLMDGFFFGGAEAEVEILQNEVNPNVFRILKPYNGITNNLDPTAGDVEDYLGSEYMDITLLQPGDVVAGETITAERTVLFTETNTGYFHPSYEQWLKIYHPSDGFSSTKTADTWGHNRVLAYQEDGVTPGQIQLAPFYYLDDIGGWNASQVDGSIVITFPGYAPKDFALDVDYAGKFIDTDGKYFATFNFTIGADVEEVRYALAPGYGEDTAAGIINGSIASETLTESGAYNVAYEGTGRYTLVAVVFFDGEPQTTAAASFYSDEYSLPDQWESLGTGLYKEQVMSELYGADDVEYSVEIQQSTTRPGIYRMVNPYGEAFPYNEEGDWDDTRDYYIEFNAEDPNGVFIPSQRTGVDWGDGELYIESLGAALLDSGMSFDKVKAAGAFGTLKDGVISFPVKGLIGSFLLDGSYQLGTGGTSITLPSAAPAAARRAPRLLTKQLDHSKAQSKREILRNVMGPQHLR